MKVVGKRLSFIFLALIFVFPGTGCSRQPQKNLPSAEEIIARHATVQREEKTWRTEMTAIMSIENKGRQGSQVITSNRTRCAVDMGQRKIRVESDISIPGFNKNKSIKTISYLIGNTQYTKADQPGRKSRWTKKELRDTDTLGMWGSMTGFLSTENQARSLGLHIAVTGVEHVNGISCYILNSRLDGANAHTFMEHLTHQGMGKIEGLPPNFSESFRDVQITYWIDKDTSRIIQSKISARLLLEIRGRKMEGDFENSTRFFDYGQELSINLPEDALSGAGQ